ncbi:BZ3500_MvSof-1268-A1-R1_Chr2-1g04437 [Microbotryum saponariae]|uniref:BZ3500_MvSof-1268-A1-R1_Chr2-1g04437 protein n=1 Tax=Microbotryum saponariae TaxID=289078 RepID=A0A2X0KE60_9BASI|nr:BZ3500_MvSof-1268-A1-R1_Chr2-1g04437 [Microbotryum saponariae]SCZ91702.1 BZ3501_MvSof-1269-A2-R1_Chr2-1g04093 [Microbotryum saponariae]
MAGSGSITDSPDEAAPRGARPRSNPRSNPRSSQQSRSCSFSTDPSGWGLSQPQSSTSPRKRSRGVSRPSTHPKFVIVGDNSSDEDDDYDDSGDDDRQERNRARRGSKADSYNQGSSQSSPHRRGTRRTQHRINRPIEPGKRIEVTLIEAKIDPSHLPASIADERASFQLPLECKLLLEPSDPTPARRKKLLRFQRRPMQDQIETDSATELDWIHVVPVQRRFAHIAFEKRWPHSTARLAFDLAGSQFALDLLDPVKDAWRASSEAVLASETDGAWIQVAWRVMDLTSDLNEETKPIVTDGQLRERLESELTAAHIDLRREIARRHLQLARVDNDQASLRRTSEPCSDFRPPPGATFKKTKPIPLSKFIYDPPPPFTHTSFLSHAMPTDLPPFEVVPPWKCIARPSANLTEKEVDQLIAEVIAEYARARPDEDCERVHMESWVKASIFNENSFERVDPMRLRRDFQALKGVMQEVGSEADEVPGSEDVLYNRRFRAQGDPKVGPKLAPIVELFQQRLGITPWELQSQAQCFTTDQVIPEYVYLLPPVVEICELCGAISCRVHEWFLEAPNVPTAHSARPPLAPPEDAQASDCGTHCHKRPENNEHVRNSYMSRCCSPPMLVLTQAVRQQVERYLNDASARDLATFKCYLDEQPKVPSCILASITKRNCFEVESIRRQLGRTNDPIEAEPEVAPVRQPLRRLKAKPLPVGNTRGYEPCGCDGPCQGTTMTNATVPGGGGRTAKNDRTTCECVKSGTWCDRFCGCHELCARRFPGCLCRLSPTFVRCVREDCECLKENRECDPHLCARFDGPDVASGTNDQIRYKKLKRTAIVRSTLPGAGFGSVSSIRLAQIRGDIGLTSVIRSMMTSVELLEDASAGDLIGLYGGEMFDVEESPALIRHFSIICSPTHSQLQEGARAGYWFDVDTLHVIDPLASGNHMRYINDLGTWNCEARWVYIDGTHQLGFYARVDLKKGDEISLDYGPTYWGKNGGLQQKKKTASGVKQHEGKDNGKAKGKGKERERLDVPEGDA